MAKSGSRSPEKGNGGFGGSGERDRERTEKFSRSTVACKGCRMRKQKVRRFLILGSHNKRSAADTWDLQCGGEK